MEAVVVKYFTNPGEVELAKGVLHEHGVWSMVRGAVSNVYIHGGGQIALVVQPKDLEKAKEILGIETYAE